MIDITVKGVWAMTLNAYKFYNNYALESFECNPSDYAYLCHNLLILEFLPNFIRAWI